VRRLAAILLLILAPACGSRVALEDRPIVAAQGGIRTAGVPQRANGTAQGSGFVAPATETSDPAVKGSSTPPNTFFTPKTKGDFALTISVKPLCVAVGSTGIASVRTKPAAGLALMVSYSDKDVAGPYTLATADAAGRYDWAFAIPPGAPTGPSEILVGAVDWERGDGVTGRTGFTIADRC